jgi:hypothetical protein
MESAPVTLGDWFEILKPSDYAEAAMLVNDGGHAPPWIPTFLMHWAPELINGRARWERAEKRKLVLDQLAIIELAAQQLTDAIDSEIIKYLQLPPHPRFESELGVRIFVSSLAVRARNAIDSPNLSTGEGDNRTGAGRAIPANDPNPRVLCAAIIAELWNFLHGSFPKTAKNALKAATSYWIASGGNLNSWSGNPDRSWTPYFKGIDDPLLRGIRIELQRQLVIYSAS